MYSFGQATEANFSNYDYRNLIQITLIAVQPFGLDTMVEHYSSQHDSVESVTSAYIAVALLAAAIIALSYTLPVVVGASLLVTVGAAVRVSDSPRREGGGLLSGVRRRTALVSEPAPDSCPR